MKIADDIIATVCAEHGIAIEQFRQTGMQTRGITAARGVAIRRLREQHFSAQWIANFIGLSRNGVHRHLYPKVKEAQRVGGQRYRARQKAARAEVSA